MLVQLREFSVTLAVDDPIEFCARQRAKTLAYLREGYEGRNFMETFIISINRILRISDCRVNTTNASGEGSVSVTFEANVALLAADEMLAKTKLAFVTNQISWGYAQADVGGLLPPPGEESSGNSSVVVTVVIDQADAKRIGGLEKDMFVPVRVTRVSYPPKAGSISVIGRLAVCPQKFAAFALPPGAALEDGGEALRPMLAEICSELRQRAQLLAAAGDALLTLEGYLYSYRSTTTATSRGAPLSTLEGVPDWLGLEALHPEEGTVNVLRIADAAARGEKPDVAGVWGRPLGIHRSSPLVSRAAAPPDGWPPAVEGLKPLAVFAGFLREILESLRLSREMAECFGDKAAYERHSRLWLVMRDCQTKV